MKSAEEWVDCYIKEMEDLPDDNELATFTSIIYRAQIEARKEATKQALKDAGNEFTMVCYWKEKAHLARREAIEECIATCKWSKTYEEKLRALLTEKESEK